MNRVAIIDSLLESKPQRKRGRPRKKPIKIVSSNVGDDIIARLIAEVRRDEQTKEHKNKKLNENEANH